MTAFHLKCLAMLIMIIDHVGYALMNNEPIMRLIGRTGFVIFAWAIANGMEHTKNQGEYIKRLLLLAIVSQVAFGIFQGSMLETANAVFTFTVGAMAIMAYEQIRNYYVKALSVILCCAVAHFGNMDWGIAGVLSILSFYIFGGQKVAMVVSQSVIFIGWGMIAGHMEIRLLHLIGVSAIMFYNGQEGIKIQKFFYSFYPAHLLGLVGIARICL